MKIIKIKNLKKYYGKVIGIEDVTLEVEKGDIYGFIGPNGSGKSTTIRTLLNLIHKTDGMVKKFVKDCSIRNHNILNDIGYLPAEVFYYNNMKVIYLLNYKVYNKRDLNI